MFCKNCGKENIFSAKFCKSCGNGLGVTVHTQPSQVDAKNRKMTFQVIGGILSGIGIIGLKPWVTTYEYYPEFKIIYPDGTPLFLTVLIAGLICLYIASKIRSEV